MAAIDTFSTISNVLRTLNDASLLYYYQNPIQQQSDQVILISWPNHNRGAAHNRESAFGTLSQYRAILQEGSYHAILRDGSMVRASYTFDNENLSTHSLWFWPCPFRIPPVDIEEFTPLDAIDLYASDWQNYVQFRSPIRFDYDPGSAEICHPASHLHIIMVPII